MIWLILGVVFFAAGVLLGPPCNPGPYRPFMYFGTLFLVCIGSWLIIFNTPI